MGLSAILIIVGVSLGAFAIAGFGIGLYLSSRKV